VLAPDTGASQRDQNSLILVNSAFFDAGSAMEVSKDVLAALPEGVAAPGDLLVSDLRGRQGRRFILASFHGDTNGLATLPVVTAVRAVATENFATHTFIMGLDANTCVRPRRPRGAARAAPGASSSVGAPQRPEGRHGPPGR
jgi:hypothetical protein